MSRSMGAPDVPDSRDAARLAIFHPPGRMRLGANPFGKDVANLELYRALARHGGFGRRDVLSLRATTAAELREDLLEGEPAAVELVPGSILSQGVARDAGALL